MVRALVAQRLRQACAGRARSASLTESETSTRNTALTRVASCVRAGRASRARRARTARSAPMNEATRCASGRSVSDPNAPHTNSGAQRDQRQHLRRRAARSVRRTASNAGRVLDEMRPEPARPAPVQPSASSTPIVRRARVTRRCRVQRGVHTVHRRWYVHHSTVTSSSASASSSDPRRAREPALANLGRLCGTRRDHQMRSGVRSRRVAAARLTATSARRPPSHAVEAGARRRATRSGRRSRATCAHRRSGRARVRGRHLGQRERERCAHAACSRRARPRRS